MTRFLWIFTMLGALVVFAACDSGKPKALSPELAARHEAPPDTFTGIEAAQTDIEDMGEMEKPVFFLTVVVDEERTPGTLPPPEGGSLQEDLADTSIRQVVYGLRAPENIARIHGFRVVRQSPPRVVPGYAHKPLNRIRVTLEVGPTDAIRFGMGGPPVLPDSPPALGYQLAAETPPVPEASADSPGQAKPEGAPPVEAPADTAEEADAVKDSDERLTRIFERDFLLNSDPNKAQFWRFEPPLEVSIPFGTGIQLTVEYLDPYLYPTQPIIEAGNVQLAIPDRYRELSSVQSLAPLEEKRPSACMGSPRGQRVCLYTSGVAELYVQAPFTEALVGSWSHSGYTLTVTIEERSWSFDTADSSQPLDFGVYGTGFVYQVQGDERLHPYFDLARELAGEGPFTVEGIRRVFHAQLDQEGEPEVVVELKTGGFAVLRRDDRFSPYRLMKRIDQPDALLQVVSIPMTGRGYVAMKNATDERWTVHVYVPGEGKWSQFLRREVPWKPWEREETIRTTPVVWEQPPDFVPDPPPQAPETPTPDEQAPAAD